MPGGTLLEIFAVVEPDPRRVRLDCRVQPPRFSLLLAPLRHLLLKGRAVVRLRLHAHIATGGKYAGVLSY